MTTIDWTNLLPDVPAQAVAGMLGEREGHPRSARFPKELAAEIDQIAEELSQEFSTVTFFLLRNALAELKAARGSKKKSLKKIARRSNTSLQG